MEKKVIFAVMLMLLFIGQATARFDKCYAACYFDCILDMKRRFPYVPKKLLPCAWKCLKHCLFHGGVSTSFDYCNIGCTMDSCSNNVDDAQKMAGCIDNCSSNTCKAIS
ncbi:thionin-like protein 2 [Citrus sinensis]|uniref:thionin-like protein 2 n=1 Tax=Citrus sinensis TaxID=2711 RepID=UPI000CED141F|nr:thionin-like protein 2 [Citrus sinensis]XP_024036856.1 thionin-like protein 2 [Citrus x clementina]